MNLSRSRALVGVAAFAVVLGFANAFAIGAEIDNPLEYLRSVYNLHMAVQTENRQSGNLYLAALTNTGQLNDYLRALARECQKYPIGFFTRAGVSEIVVCGALDMGGAPISGIFNSDQRRLYMKYHWCQQGARCRVTFHAFHHELGHAVQTAALGNGHYEWREWTALNPSYFNYGSGGDAELMANPERNWATWSTNQPGFLNAYGTTAPWEDRSEIMAALMNDADRVRLPRYYQHDPIIQKKIALMSELLSKIAGPSQQKYFWEEAVNFLKRQPELSLNSTQSAFSKTVDLQKAIGRDLIDSGGNAVSFETLKGKKYFLLYYSASWCFHCKQFMPQFLEYYRNSRNLDKFEVIFVSSDRSEAEMMSCMREVPWKAVRFGSAAESFLKTNYGRGPAIPELVLIDSDGRFLSIRKGFAKNYEYGVEKMLDILNKKLAEAN